MSEEKYEWQCCGDCGGRIFKNEVEGDSIKTIDGKVYCIECSHHVHELKTEKEYFRAVRSGIKTFEIRKNDREFGYDVGDTLILRECTYTDDGEPLYSGNKLYVMVNYVTSYEQKEGYVVLGIVPVKEKS